MGTPPRLWLVDHPGSGAPDAATIAAYCAAIQKGLDGDFGPRYNRSCTLAVLGDAKDLAPGDLLMGLFATLDQAGALGYHEPDELEDLTIANPLIGKISPVLDAQDGAQLSQTLDHEVKEALEDLLCDSIIQCADGRLAADECCDAVEQDSYTIDGVALSNFVLPGWYTGKGKFDFLGKLSAPMTVDAGGYCQFLDPAAGWQQVTSSLAPPRAYRMRALNERRSRSARRAAKWLATRAAVGRGA
jgi:hypothetical protein